MKRIYFLLLLILIVLPANSKNNIRVQKFEGEIWLGIAHPIGGYHGGDGVMNGALGINLRYNIKDTPWDAGAFLRLDGARYNYGNLEQGNRTLGFGVSGGYNFRQGKKINPFVNFGIGIGGHDIVSDYVYPSGGTSMVVIPTIGIEFLYHIRLNGYCELSRHGYNTVGFSLGLVVGGRLKKQEAR